MTATASATGAILEVLYSCGVRLAEIAGMDLPDVNFAQRQILVEGKGSKRTLGTVRPAHRGGFATLFA